MEANVYYFEGTVRSAPWSCIPPFFFSPAAQPAGHPDLNLVLLRVAFQRLIFLDVSLRSRAHLPVLEEVPRYHSGSSGNNEKDAFLIKRLPVRESSQPWGPTRRKSLRKTCNFFLTFLPFILTCRNSHLLTATQIKPFFYWEFIDMT